MSNLDDLQRRISAAMDRVAQGLDQINSAPAGPDPEMVQALEDERTANAQLTERVRALKTKADEQAETEQAQRAEIEEKMGRLDVEIQRLRHVNCELNEACAALRDANSEGVADPHLINKAMMSELESLRAARASEVAEANAILSALTPLLEATAPAAEVAEEEA
ncbi:MAG: hypothetical protein AAF943_11665 [Pseudomonadota bacterium]